MKTNNYFESIGAWPAHSGHMERTYVIGFLASLVLTFAAYAIAVYDLAPVSTVVPVVLVFACLQFIVQVLNFLHVSGASPSRERLVVLLCTALIMLILVLGTMWIMTNLDSRMMPNLDQEAYMQRQQGF